MAQAHTCATNEEELAMPGGCECSGNGSWCCSGRSGRAINRREFIQSTAAAAGGLSLVAAGQELPQREPTQPTGQDWNAWNAQLLEKGERRRYRGAELEHVAMPLGGIGAGQVFITGRGRLEQWQIVNNFNANANVAGAFFAVWAKQAGRDAVSRVLQEGGYENAPGIDTIEFSGEYPFAWLEYGDEALPVRVTLEACSPFIPTNSKDSALPAVLFRFAVKNTTDGPVETALLASAPNLIGWDGYAAITDGRHRDFVGNENTFDGRDGAGTVRMVTRCGEPDRLSKTCQLLTNDHAVAYSMGQCAGIKCHLNADVPGPDGATRAVFWIGDLSGQDRRKGLGEVLDAVKNGASLIIAGNGDTLLTLTDRASNARRDELVFENWESGTCEGWTVEGEAFGDGPAKTTVSDRRTGPGGSSRYLINTSREGDGATGRIVSKPFKIAHRFIHLLLAGGAHPGMECVNLKVGGETVATATGSNTQRLSPVRWDISAHLGRRGVIEIVDAHAGDWGHLIVDDIVFSNSPTSPFLDTNSAKGWRAAMPLDWELLRWVADAAELERGSAVLAGISERTSATRARWIFENAKLKPGARVLLQTKDGAPLVVEGPFGKGKVTVCAGAIHEWFGDVDRKRFIGNLVALALEAAYQERTGWREDGVFYGSMALTALDVGDGVSALPQWRDFESLWANFREDGRFDAATSGEGPSEPGTTWNAALSVPVTLGPGEEQEVRFVLSWHFPNRMRDHRYGLGPPPPQYDFRLGNQYNNWFKNAAEVSGYVAANYGRLETETRAFHGTFYDSTLPRWLLDGITANISTIRSPIIMWLEDGTVAGFEGSDACCPMNCTHVYNYAMATAFLFPELERRVREIDLLEQMHQEGHFIPHRTVLPLSAPRLGNEIAGPYHHALDGELGTILKTYREWRQCGNTAWLTRLWPNMKKVMEHVLRDHDDSGDGVIRGEQPNTYDTHAYGSNTFIGSLYLATLRATEEMANMLGDGALSDACRTRFEKGTVGYDRTCWNGEYYYNVYDAPDIPPEAYERDNCWGRGCHSDQLLGQWWAHIAGLGPVLPRERVRQALGAVYTHNWLRDMSSHVHSQRVFAEGAEKGLLCCTWPHGGRPQHPIRYCDEVWTGIEYEVAALLLWEGMTIEGLRIAKGARDRYTGDQRNPWCEIECGGHYARGMAAYSLLLAASGFDANAADGSLAFAPRLLQDDFKSFFSLGRGWGSFSQRRAANDQTNRVEIAYGSLELRRFSFELPEGVARNLVTTVKTPQGVIQAAKAVEGRTCTLTFERPVTLRAGEYIEVRTA